MRTGAKRGTVGVILAGLILGCAPGAPAVKKREMAVDLTVTTIPQGARIFVNSDPMGTSPARVSLPCVVTYREKGDPLYARRTIWFGTFKTCAAILGYSFIIPVSVMTWPYGLFVGVVAGDQETMLLPITAAKGALRQAENLRKYRGRAEATEVLGVRAFAGSTIEVSAEWEDEVVRRCIDLRWFVRNPCPASPTPTAELTLIPDTP